MTDEQRDTRTSTAVAARPDVVDRDEFERRREELLVAEKEATRTLDRVAAQRRRLPMVRLPSAYTFEGSDGPVTLLDLFAGRPQLVVYQFMDVGPDAFCPGCTHYTRGVPAHALAELADNDTSYATVSNMPVEQMRGYWADQGWTIPYYSSRGTSFSTDTGAGDMFQLGAYLRDGDEVFQTYRTSQRGVDRLVFTNSVLDLVPYGRQEDWEDSPDGWPQHPTYG